MKEWVSHLFVQVAISATTQFTILNLVLLENTLTLKELIQLISANSAKMDNIALEQIK